ncbi:hypothetical protein EVAR_61338_1 [Eumeta japonica]|uniref:Uncharacterized protein n=1 Tax=Eumeta variegata TaxID=151549 RepID=A0A4C1Y2D3_EUMVA|nr:hypothetical protein EVAR_61338_1 [Eumeta japonica]
MKIDVDKAVCEGGDEFEYSSCESARLASPTTPVCRGTIDTMQLPSMQSLTASVPVRCARIRYLIKSCTPNNCGRAALPLAVLEGQTSRRRIQEEMITAVHGHSQHQRAHQRIAGMLEETWR